jgi:putative transposase
MTRYNPQRHHRRSVRLRGYDYSQPGAYFVTINVRDGECVLGDVVEGQVQLTAWGDIARGFWAQVPARFPHVSIDELVVMPNHVHAVIMIHESVQEGAMTAPVQVGDGRGGVIPPKGDGAQGGAMTAPRQTGDGRGGVIPPQGDGGQEGAMTAPLRMDGGRGGVIPLQGEGVQEGAQEGAMTAPLRTVDGRGGVIPPQGDDVQEGAQEGAMTAPLRTVDGRGGVIPPHDPSRVQRPTLGQIVAYYKYETTKQINDLCGNDPMPFWQRSFYEHIIRNRRGLEAVRTYIADNPLNWELDQDHPSNVFSARKGNSYGI